jgi:hypothetical protein
MAGILWGRIGRAISAAARWLVENDEDHDRMEARVDHGPPLPVHPAAILFLVSLPYICSNPHR